MTLLIVSNNVLSVLYSWVLSRLKRAGGDTRCNVRNGNKDNWNIMGNNGDTTRHIKWKNMYMVENRESVKVTQQRDMLFEIARIPVNG